MPANSPDAMLPRRPEMLETGEHGFRRIAVIGGGIVGLSAAVAFARALPRTPVEIIATPVDPAALADRMTGALPSIKAFHAQIGMTETELIRLAATTHRLGTRFDRWPSESAPWLHCFGAHGGPSAGFHQQWLRARHAGDPTPFHAYSPAAALALAERFAEPVADTLSPLADIDYALRLDPVGYRAVLVALARHCRIALSNGQLAQIERDEQGSVAALMLTDGRRIEADLFIDCSGPGAMLLSALDHRFEDWGATLPCDRLLFGRDDPPALSLIDTAAALDCGWWWRSPGRAATATGLAYVGAITPADEAARAFRAAGHEPAGGVTIRPGRRPASWIRNVIGFGDAAVAVDPLQSANLHLAHSAILRAIELLPDRHCPALVLSEYNRRTADETARVRDFLAAHYLAAAPRKGAFWRSMARRALPDSLAETLDQFRRRGRLPHFEEESFTRDDWLAVLLGLGITPARIDPTAEEISELHARALLRQARDRATSASTHSPRYRDYYTHLLGAGAPQSSP